MNRSRHHKRVANHVHATYGPKQKHGPKYSLEERSAKESKRKERKKVEHTNVKGHEPAHAKHEKRGHKFKI